MELGSATWLTKSSAEGLLSTFYMEWQALNWPQYGSASLASDVIADISGGVYYTLSRVPNHAISLALLPSARSRSHLPPSIIRSGYADCVAVHKAHGLLVVATIRKSVMMSPPVLLFFHSMLTFFDSFGSLCFFFFRHRHRTRSHLHVIKS